MGQRLVAEDWKPHDPILGNSERGLGVYSGLTTSVMPDAPASAGSEVGASSAPIRSIPDERDVLREDELALCRRVARGDHAAFRVLVERYQDRLFGFCVRMLDDRAEAEDVAQDVLVTLFRNASAFRGESSFATWLFRIARNQTLNRIKHLDRRGKSWRRAWEAHASSQPEGAPVEEPDVVDRLVTQERSALVQEAIASLAEEHRMVLVLRDIEDMSYEDICEVTGLPLGTVKSRLHRARSQLVKRLERIGT